MAKREINFEVQVQQKGRWEIHARHASERREVAIEDAMSLEKMPGVEDVKVIRESYDPDDGSSVESVVYKGAKGRAKGSRAKPAPARPSSPSQSSGNRDGEFWDAAGLPRSKPKSARQKARTRQRKPRKETTISGVIVRILMIILFSIALSSLATGLSISFLDKPRVMGFVISSTVRTYLLFAIFVTTFLMTAWPMSRSLMSSANLAIKKSPPRRRAAPEQNVKVSKPKPGGENPFAYSEETTDQPDQGGKGENSPEGEPPRDISGNADDAAKAAAEALHKARKEEEAEKRKTAQEQDAEAETALVKGLTLEEDKHEPPEEPPEEQPEEPAKKPLSSFAEKQRVTLMRFFVEALEQIPQDKKNFDKFNKFGVSLYIAGACEGLCQKRNLDPRSASRIVADAAELLGYEKTEAERFSDKYEDYLVSDARYMQMFQSGRNSMITAIEDGDAANPGQLLDTALTEWNTPKKEEDKTGPVTVMFTDMVGSTALTQSLGDAVAQQVVRAHNRVVREALAQFSGKEVKHTGDGIMASFSSTSNSVDAAIDIQRGTEKHNRNNPDLPLKIKIGINAGEPIAEDNDLFGTTVQLSARIVDKAQADQIFVSDIVRGICAGKEIEFKNLGPFDMKGFKGGINLYEVMWLHIGEEPGSPEADGQTVAPGGQTVAPGGKAS